jgi:hypothetical protein
MGDGTNDYCPITKLPNDLSIGFVRKNYNLDSLVKKK